MFSQNSNSSRSLRRLPLLVRYLAIDLGDKRTGLALGDAHLRLATPVETLHVPADREEGRALRSALRDASERLLGAARTSPGELVLGLPLNMDGTEGPRAVSARRFALVLEQDTGRRVHLHDERLTSAAADWAMAMSGLTHKQKKERRDALAAAALLQGFLDALPRSVDA